MILVLALLDVIFLGSQFLTKDPDLYRDLESDLEQIQIPILGIQILIFKMSLSSLIPIFGIRPTSVSLVVVVR